MDLDADRIYPARVVVDSGRIAEIREISGNFSTFLAPGFVDAHVHIESSLLIPTEFARLAVRQGTIATVSDPHEIANVLGMEGVEFMLRNAARTPFHFFFGAPSCVPATPFETAGAALGPAEVETLLSRPDILYLSEMMNFPGVVNGDPEVMAKLELARRFGKPVDGHAPGLRGEALAKYVAAGIRNDHECYTLDEAREKRSHGMVIAIREGSAARNFAALEALLHEDPEHCLFCTDDMHLDNLERGHINRLVARAVAGGVEPLTALKVGSTQTIEHYHLPVGRLRVGDAADFIELEDLQGFRVLRTFIGGAVVSSDGDSRLPSLPEEPVNQWNPGKVTEELLRIPAGEGLVRVIQALDQQLVTGCERKTPTVCHGEVVTDVERDILKLVVQNRYEETAVPAVALVRGFGLREGAMASSVGHDSHNILAVGVDDCSLVLAMDILREKGGGLVTVDGQGDARVFPLPVGGLMTHEEAFGAVRAYKEVEARARELGSTLTAPFMTLSFMALLVIPELKLSDKGLFDGKAFSFVPLFDSSGESA